MCLQVAIPSYVAMSKAFTPLTLLLSYTVAELSSTASILFSITLPI